ncbi:MAG: Calx-beta domain-containing protein [Actinomycetota bacterium]
MVMARSVIAAVMVAAVMVAPTTGAAKDVSKVESDGRGHDIIYLATFAPNLKPATSGYAVPEFDGIYDGVTIQREQHGTEPGQVDYATSEVPGGANEEAACAAGVDYARASGTRTLQPTDTADVSIRLCGDTIEEGAETFTFTLSNPKGAAGMVLSFPREATVTIVDDDGPDRFSFAAASYSQFENRRLIELMVVRQGGPVSAEATVRLTTADGTAIDGSDYEAVDQTVQFLSGQRVKRVPVTLLDNCQGEPTERFTATLSDSSGPALVAPTTTTVDILDDDGPAGDSTPPVTAFHIPQHGKRYGRMNVATKQVHISPSDEASGLDYTCGAKVQLALQKKFRNGKCKWWGGSRWKAGACSAKRWLKMPLNQCPDPNRCLIFYTLKQRLQPTTRKTGIRHFQAWARSRDTAGNLETRFQYGRNRSRFYVKS